MQIKDLVYMLDTSVLMEAPKHVKELCNTIREMHKQDGDTLATVCIPNIVISELINLKSNSAKARKALAFIDSFSEEDKESFVDFHAIDSTGFEMLFEFNNNDEKLFEFVHTNTIYNVPVALVTCDRDFNRMLDIFLSSLSYIGGNDKPNFIDLIDIETEVEELYKGWRELTDEKEILLSYNYPLNNPLGFKANEYIIIGDNPRRYDINLKRLVSLDDNSKYIKPKNILQRCALDLVRNPDIPIVALSGTAGSGKTFIAVGESWSTNRKILALRNTVGDTDSADIGFLPGELEDKIGAFFKSFSDQVNVINAKVSKGKRLPTMEEKKKLNMLEIDIPVRMKGRSLNNTIVIVDEAEDLTKKTFKMLGTRIAEGSSIIYSGDFKQAEKKYAKDSGLVHLINSKVAQQDSLVGVLILEDDVRSASSKSFVTIFG